MPISELEHDKSAIKGTIEEVDLSKATQDAFERAGS
jgi:hypothetical protein